MDKLTLATAQIAAGAAVLIIDMGFSWVTTGYGFHPVAAGALATVLILAPWMMPAQTKAEA